MRVINATGTLQMNYKVVFKQLAGDEFAQVELLTALPGKEYEMTDLIIELRAGNYKDNLRLALLKAEERWGIDLLKIELNTLV